MFKPLICSKGKKNKCGKSKTFETCYAAELNMSEMYFS